MNEAYLILGGNIPDRMEYLQLAIFELNKINVYIDAKSSIYETEAWGSNSIFSYLNMAMKIRTEASAEMLLSQLLIIEKKIGRQRDLNHKNADRTMDIDILFFNDLVIKTDTLEIPHPRLHLRNFVLKPMMEIAHNFIHPILKKTIETLYLQCEDELEVRFYSNSI
jgi:2-amino-4-hydroxy-6-hydroxymethyldihydropteridine diphosphokinase